MKKRRKHSSCLNCGELLDKKYNYCPNCGQENTDNELSLGMLLKEFTSNFFSLDSRFGRSLKPFLLSPGKITEAFNVGKRVRYANPIRWYLVISILHFFFMARVYEPSSQDRQEQGFIQLDEEITAELYDSLFHVPDTDTNSWPMTENQYKLVDYLTSTSSLTPEEIIDSLQLNQKPWIDRLAIKQFLKLNQESNASLNTYLLRQIPIIIFFLLPVYAFLLKLFFWKKGRYIRHVIHSIHLHAFFFFTMGCTWIISLFWEAFKEYGIAISLALCFVYIILSFRRVYKAKIISCVLKLLGIGFIYQIVLSIVMLIGIVLSLLLF